MVNEQSRVELGRGQQAVVAAFVLVGVWYLSWRPGTFNPEAPVFSWVVYGAEVYGFATALLHAFMVWRLNRPRPAPEPPPGLTVDVFIPTLNESPELVRRTLLAARHMAYPHTTWLLDDGDRPEMRALAAEVGCRYLARGHNRHGKAGNLNHALAHTSGAYVAVFDADHAPRRDFLTRTLGYFADPGLAFVQTPQDFYNLDSYQHRRKPGRAFVWTEQSLFFRVIMPGKDRWNAAFFAGSCAVVRRRALDSVGGFATGTVTEDLHTSLRLHKAGYRSRYLPASLAFGLAPATVRPFLSQRVRWGRGAMQVWRQEGVLTARGLSLAQRLNYLASMATYFDGWQKAIFYLAPAYVLFTGVMPIAQFGWVFLAHFLPYFLLNFWAFEELGRGYGRSVYIEQYNMARFAAFIWATLGLVRGTGRFRVTAKEVAGGADAQRLVAPQTVVFGLNAAAIPAGTVLWALGYGLPPGAFAANLFWSGLNVWLAAAVLVFTLRVPRRRRDYRFPVALPARLRGEGVPAGLALVEDLAPGGLRLHLPAATAAPAPGSEVAGEVLLPGGPVRFRGEVRMAVAHPAEGLDLGLTLHWSDAAERDRLTLFLYGSDLQWRFFQLREAERTPLQAVTEAVRRRRGEAVPATLARWLPVACRIGGAGGREVFGIAAPAADGSLERVALFEAVPAGTPLRLARPTASGTVQQGQRVRDVRQLDTPVGPLAIHTLHPPLAASDARDQATVLDPGLAAGR